MSTKYKVIVPSLLLEDNETIVKEGALIDLDAEHPYTQAIVASGAIRVAIEGDTEVIPEVKEDVETEEKIDNGVTVR